MPEPSIDTSNYRKFRTANPVVRYLVGAFYRRLASIVAEVDATSVLDAGCGEGETIERLRPLLPRQIVGCDLREECVAFASRRHPDGRFQVEDVYRLSFDDRAFDLVICLEVLEHLHEPSAALAELWRVTATDLILSVPHEPYFQLGSLVRGKYLRTLGNHPEHVQHWSPTSLRELLEQAIGPVRIVRSFPWLIAHVSRAG